MNVWVILTILIGHATGWVIYFMLLRECVNADSGHDDVRDDDDDDPHKQSRRDSDEQSEQGGRRNRRRSSATDQRPRDGSSGTRSRSLFSSSFWQLS